MINFFNPDHVWEPTGWTIDEETGEEITLWSTRRVTKADKERRERVLQLLRSNPPHDLGRATG